MGYLTAYMVVITMGMFQFGYCLGGFNALQNVTLYRFGWLHKPNPTFYEKNYVAILTALTNLGAMIACLGAGPLMKYGKWNMIVATNAFVIAASAICMVDNPSVILFGRFLYGIASGAFSVFCPKYVAEITPIEYRGPFGSLNQLMCTIGIFIIACMGIPIPNSPNELDNPKDSFMIANYWRVLWGLPIIFSVLQIVCMMLIFKYETPPVLKERADFEKLTELYSKMYVKEQIKWRMDEIAYKKSEH